MKKIMLCYPPGDLTVKIKNKYKFQTLDVIPAMLKACNDLGYIAAVLNNQGHNVFLKDYKIQQNSPLDLLDDILNFNPDMIVLHTSFPNVFEDLKIIRMIKSSNPEIVTVLYGDLFFNPSADLLSNLPLGGVDYLIGADEAFVLPLLIACHFNSPQDVFKIPFITVCKNGLMQKTNFNLSHGDINDLPAPARNMMKNEYYYRPDNMKVTATIITSSGCDKKCIHCSEYNYYGPVCHIRPASKVFEEMYDCYNKYGITNFFFPLDTFSHSEKWVEELCDLIIDSPMNNNIEWIANVNIATFTEYMASEMKAAGCSMLVMRFDCGSDDSLFRMNRGFTVDESLNSVEIAKKAKLKIYGLYSMGLPWENQDHLIATKKLILKSCPDYISLALPVAYPDSHIESAFKDANILKSPSLSKDGLNLQPLGTKFLSHQFISNFREKTLLRYYLNPALFLKKLLTITKEPDLFLSYLKYIWFLFKNKSF